MKQEGAICWFHVLPEKGETVRIAESGNYPIEVPKEQPKDKFENKLNQFSSYYQVLD